MARFCLNSIVKNESARITRMLDSVAQYITAAVIADTGSTDNTKQVITDWCKAHRIPLVLVDVEFTDWSQARNAALDAGRLAVKMHTIPVCDYFLLIDADMEIRINDPIRFAGYTGGLSYDMYQVAGALHYQNRRMIKVDAPGGYLGVTHEYLDIATAGCIPEAVAYFIDHADGANRPEKFKRDIRLLKDGLRQEPSNARYFFYLAQSYRDAGQPLHAAHWFKKRVKAGGWDEEVWCAQVNYAHCMRALGKDAEFIRNLLIAYNMRPSRAEPLYDLANYYRLRGEQVASLVFSEAGLQIPKSKDALFVNDFVYESGLAEEYSICAFYQPSKRKNGFVVTDHLALKKGPYAGARELARHNLFWYLPKFAEFCPSFKSRKIDFEPPENWIALNPSVTNVKGQLACVVRTVNYRIDEHGRYMIRGTDGTANATNPINTRNYLVWLGTDPFTHARSVATEIYVPVDLPCEFPLVIGFEDMRLFEWKNGLWTSSTVRQIHPDGNCEQVLALLQPASDSYVITNVKRMLREPRQTQKNWAPIHNPADDSLRFLYKPGHVVDIHGNDYKMHPSALDTDQIRGSSQLIPFEAGWLSVHHEAQFVPGRQTRHYFHRLMYHDAEFRLMRVSQPFVFDDKQIEFCAGLCWHPDDDQLVLSYGSRDCEARIATVDHKEVSRMLWFQPKDISHGH
jgi:glycosyltransferase involved in cell wall biosynthesis